MASGEYDTEVDASGGAAVPSDNDRLLVQLKTWFRYDAKHAREWRKAAKEDWKFYNGDQWSDEDRLALKNAKRPELTFNRIGPLVNAIVGSEINNRREVRFFPREEGDAIANEMLTGAAEWFRDQCGAEDEESDAFKADVVCGMGWTDTRLDFDSNPDGDPVVENIDEMEMVWDCNAVKPNLADMRRAFRVREMTYAEAAELTGVSERSKLHAAWAVPDKTDGDPHDQDEADDYTGTQSDGVDVGQKKCTLVEARWLERETFYRGPDMQGGVREYDAKQFEAVDKLYRDRAGEPFPAVKQQRKVVRRAFIGSQILGKVDKPMAPAGQFGWECITGYKDKDTNHWYGAVRASKDPARWSNKFFSQVMFLLNSQAKGGIVAERGAFENDREAEQSWAKSDAITWAKAGALSSEKPKIIPKSPAQFPAGFFTLFQEAKEALTEVTGLSPEFIGTREVDQAGVLEYQRRQSTLNLLAELFNALRRYRKRQGRTLLHLLKEMPNKEARLIRINGEDKAEYVRMSRIDMASAEYDIIVDDSPTSPNEKDRTWQIITQMLPFVKDMLTPDIVIELLSSSPLPASTVEKFKKKYAEAQAQPKPPSPEEQALALKAQEAQIDQAGKVADLEHERQMNAMDAESKMVDLMVDVRKAEIEQETAENKAVSDMRNLAIKEEANRIAAKRAANGRTSAAKG